MTSTCSTNISANQIWFESIMLILSATWAQTSYLQDELTSEMKTGKGLVDLSWKCLQPLTFEKKANSWHTHYLNEKHFVWKSRSTIYYALDFGLFCREVCEPDLTVSGCFPLQNVSSTRNNCTFVFKSKRFWQDAHKSVILLMVRNKKKNWISLMWDTM